MCATAVPRPRRAVQIASPALVSANGLQASGRSTNGLDMIPTIPSLTTGTDELQNCFFRKKNYVTFVSSLYNLKNHVFFAILITYNHCTVSHYEQILRIIH